MYDTRDERTYSGGDVEEAASGIAVNRPGPPVKRAGLLPYFTLLGGAVTVVIGQLLAAAAR
jgi:hypothetical protein